MGVEWTLACVACRNHAWLGSMKPWKWDGFQMGNRFVAELLALHAAAGCSLIVTSDACAFEPPWEHDKVVAGFREDLRSRWFWDSLRHDMTPPQMVCATCEASLNLPSIPDAEELRRAGYAPAVGGVMPLIVGRYLWFCGPRCRDAYEAAPGRTWRGCPEVPTGTRIHVSCLRCGVESSLGEPEPEPSDALAFAEWLTEHVYNPPRGSDLDAPAGCRLKVSMDAPAEVLDPESPEAVPRAERNDG